jgi:malate dehydrogenase (oxaloacetate-decarboxylating)(NADP+)
MSFTKQDALDYHRKGRPGKIQVTPTKPLSTQLHLSLAYSPGVAEAVLEVANDPLQAFELTARANLVGVVSNGTAILGLGDLGPLASKPVMEGKGVLFKKFADIDVFDIEIDASTVDEIVAAVKALAPTFGGINLEDIKAPEAFEVEERLKAELDIPVFHDDQHGTAIISGAALLSACKHTGKDIATLKVVVNGAGASAIATSRFYIMLGVKPENLLMVDSKGVIYAGRKEGMNKYKEQFAVETEARTLADAMVGADMVLGLSVAGSITQEMVATMAEDPFIFVLANPTPEIMPELALEVRPKAIIGTGRSDYPNQINNVLGFPFLFRGALDVHATSINDEMKLAAAHALADLAHEDVPDSVLSAYGLKQLKFGADYLIPKPLDPRVLLWVAPAVAQAAMDSGVARKTINIEEYKHSLFARQGDVQSFRNHLSSKAKLMVDREHLPRVVYGEGDHPRILRAAYQVYAEGIAEPILLGDKTRITELIKELGLEFSPSILSPSVDLRPDFVESYRKMRERKGISQARAETVLYGRSHYGMMMVKSGEADAFISGITHEYPDVIRPALQIFGTNGEVKHVAGLYLMIINGRVFIFTDATVNIEPDAETLAEIAILANDFAKTLDIDPRVAMLSFSNFGSTPHPLSQRPRDAVDIVLSRRPDIVIDGEMQADSAVVEAIIEERYPFSRVKDANVLVFPDLSSANIAYKLLARLTDSEAIGPILLGVGAPVHVLQAGDEVDDIVTMTAVAVMDFQTRK